MVSRPAIVYFLQKDLHVQCSHISGVLRSTCQNPGKSYLLSRPCFYYEKNKMKVKLGKLEARKSVAPLCFILSSPPTGQSATIKYQIFFTKKEVHVCHVICYISLILPFITSLNERIPWSALLFTALDIKKNIYLVPYL